jgi:hypothetical protein
VGRARDSAPASSSNVLEILARIVADTPVPLGPAGSP